jgi:hypothetical protein
VMKTNSITSNHPHPFHRSSIPQNFTWSSHHSRYKSAIAPPFTHFLTLNCSQTSPSFRFWCSPPRLILKSKFLVNYSLAMSPRTPNVGVVDFDEEEVRVQPRDTSKREIFGVPAQLRFAYF